MLSTWRNIVNGFLLVVAFGAVIFVVKVLYTSEASINLKSSQLLPPRNQMQELNTSLRPDRIVSNSAYCSLCDVVIAEVGDAIEKVPAFDGFVICAKTNFLSKVRRFAEKNTKKFVLITLLSDYNIPKSRESFPGDYTSLLQDANLLSWFGLNVVARHCKLKTIPIGIRGELEDEMRQGVIKYRRNFDDREISVYINFSVRNEALRVNIYKKFCDTNSSIPRIVCKQPHVPFDEFARDLGNTKFVISPPGNGIDCYRHYESMLFGAIPIVMKHELPGLFHGLPLLTVDSYDEVTPAFLLNAATNAKNLSARTSLDKLYLPYWKREIEDILAYHGIERTL